jgi:hypothetical protein
VRSTTIANLVADCPPEPENTEANRRAYPRCTLFRATDIRLRSGYRADRSDIIVGAILVGIAGDLTCVAECDRTGARVSEVVLGAGLLSLAVVGVYYWLEAITGGDYKH